MMGRWKLGNIIGGKGKTALQLKAMKGESVLFVSHDLSLSGAPIMLFDTCKVMMAQGYFAVVYCPKDGPLRKMYEDVGVEVVIDDSVLKRSTAFGKIAGSFELIICNTIVTWPVVRQMQGQVKTIWWIQEGQVLEHFTSKPEVVETLRQARHLIGVSNYSISFVRKYNPDIFKLYNACYDIYDGKVNSRPELVISLIGSVEPRKGHDILMRAIEGIDSSLLDKVEIQFIGRVLDRDFNSQLKKDARNMPFIQFIGEKSHAECLEYLRKSDVVLNVSRDDPFPVVLVEAFCCAKACIVSSHSGLEELIEDGRNGFVFRNEDPADLRLKLETILKDRVSVKRIGEAARETYLEKLTIERFQEKLMKYINDGTSRQIS